MKKWILKAIVQKTLSFLPQGEKINFLFQKYVTKGIHLSDDYFYDRLQHAKQHLIGYARGQEDRRTRESSKNMEYFSTKGSIIPKTSLEIGTGWHPTVKKDRGVMSHFIDMSDHFAHFDRSINIYNFLQFSDRQWKWIDNSIQPQSRLRIDDYRSMYQELEIPISQETFRSGDITELQSIRLNEQYAHLPAGMVAISHCHFISYMPA